MKKLKKLFAGALSVTVLSSSVVMIYADEAVEKEVSAEVEVSVENNVDAVEYDYFKGTIVDIDVRDDDKLVSVKDDNDETVNFIITEDTIFVNENELVKDKEIIGFFALNAPAPLIFPPQYRPVAVGVDLGDTNVKVVQFDKDFLSVDGSLKLNVNEDTPIVLPNGDDFEGEITEDHTLIVLYGPTTRSIPPQTSPEKIIVLVEEDEVVNVVVEKTTEETTEVVEEIEETTAVLNYEYENEDVPNMNIVVNGNVVNAPRAYIKDDVVMVPVSFIAKELELNVGWNGELRVVTVGDVTFNVGDEVYNVKGTGEFELAASEIIDDRTYVPLNFFSDVLDIETAAIINNQIVVEEAVEISEDEVDISDVEEVDEADELPEDEVDETEELVEDEPEVDETDESVEYGSDVDEESESEE